MFNLRALVASLISALLGVAPAAAQPAAWTPLEAMPADVKAGEPWIRPLRFAPFQLDDAALRVHLATVPMESFPLDFTRGVEILIPHPDGGFGTFRCFESPVMEPELAAKFPEIKTYLGQGLDDPAATVRLDLTPQGFHAMVLSPNGDYWVDPYTKGDINHYASYYRRDLAPRPFDQFICGTTGESAPIQGGYGERLSGNNLRTFRLACAATGEYTAFHGGTVALGQAAIVTAINRVTGVYEREVTVRLTLVANNSNLVYTNSATDPYTNNNGGTMLAENQANITSVIGSANYDIGHVFSTGGGGVAGLGVVCSSGNKARGVTGLPSPTGDPFYIDYVCHEMGHQFNAGHTFNGTGGSCSGNRSTSNAFEPGSGSTIMSYAGICGADNLQNQGDVMFHSRSHEQIIAYISAGGGGAGCGTTTATGNSIPLINAGTDYNVPINTPFTATILSSSDANGDTLSYSWEERDLGAAQVLSDADNGTSPIFRPWTPVAATSRTFPRLASVLSGVLVAGEKYPALARTMTLNCTVRDNRAGGGGVRSDNIIVNVRATAGPFAVTSPNTAVSWPSGSTQTVTWNVVGTDISPFSAANVRILLSIDGGNTFPTTLLASTPNDGSEAVVLPTVGANTTTCRVRVEPIGQIFFDVSNVNFTIQAAPPPNPPTGVSATPNTVCAGGTVSLQATVGAGETVDWFTGTCGGTLVGSGSPLEVVVPSTQLYRARARRLSDGAVSTCANASVTTVSGPPTAPTSAGSSRTGFCASDAGSITLTVSGGSGGLYMWYADACGGTPIGSGNSLVIASPAATTTYFARLENVCGASGCVSTTVNVNPSPVAPGSASVDRTGFCADDGGTITLSAAGGSGTYAWFEGSCGGASIGSGDSLVINSPTVSTTYFVRCENACGASACASASVAVIPPPAIASVSVSGSAPFIRGTDGLVTVTLSSIAPAGGSSVSVTSSAFAATPVLIAEGQTIGSAPVTFTSVGVGQTADASAATCATGAATSSPFDVILLPDSYVSTAGNDANRGDSAAAPVQHIELAIARTAPGGTIHLAAGGYHECVAVTVSLAFAGETPGPVTWTSACSGAPIVTIAGGAAAAFTDIAFVRESPSVGRALAVGAGASATAARCTFSGFSSPGAGGAIEALGSVSLRDCTLSGNSAADGGAIAVSGPASIVNCTFSGNTATGQGGAIAAMAGAAVTLNHCTIAFNAAASGGGIAIVGGTAAPANTIVWGNTAASGPDGFGAITSGGYNLVGDSAGLTGLAATDLSGVDPMLTALADNGGPTRTLALSAGSPAVDASDAGACDPDRDQRGIERPIDGNGDGAAVCDIGAFELEGGAPYCPADFNQDGGVDGGDVDAFFTAWEAGESIADVNFDGGVDGGDVDTFFTAWEAGGC